MIAQSNRLRISNLVTFSTDQPAPKSEEETDFPLILVRISISHNPVLARGLSRNQEMKIGRAPVSTYAAEFGFAATATGNCRRLGLACLDVPCSHRNVLQTVSNRRLSRFSVPLLPKPRVRGQKRPRDTRRQEISKLVTRR